MKPAIRFSRLFYGDPIPVLKLGKEDPANKDKVETINEIVKEKFGCDISTPIYPATLFHLSVSTTVSTTDPKTREFIVNHINDRKIVEGICDILLSAGEETKFRFLKLLVQSQAERGCFTLNLTDDVLRNDLETAVTAVKMAGSTTNELLKLTFDETFSESAANKAKRNFLSNFYIPKLETDTLKTFLQNYSRPKLDARGQPMVYQTYLAMWEMVFEAYGMDECSPEYTVDFFDDVSVDILLDLRKELNPLYHRDRIVEALILFHGRDLKPLYE